MDSVTHLAVGALAPFAFKNSPRLAAVVLFGIVAGELPDIDLLAGASAQAMLVIHRGATHSLPAIVVFSLLLAVLFKSILAKVTFKQSTVRLSDSGGLAVFNRPADWALGEIWMLMLFILTLHVYLDCMTTFGTQIFWPLSNYRVAIPAMFIVDPFLTVPLLLVMAYCLYALRKPAKHRAAAVWAKRAIIFTICYPMFCLGVYAANSYWLNYSLYSPVGQAVETVSTAATVSPAGSTAPDDAGFEQIEQIVLTPMPLSPIYWKAVAVSESEYRLARAATQGIWRDAALDMLRRLPLDLSISNSPMSAERMLVFGKPYKRVNPAMWGALQEAVPTFRLYANFASFPVVRAEDVFFGGRELTFEDLRYVPTGPEDLSNIGGRGNGMFIMQARMRDADKALMAWRYLGKIEDAEKVDWIKTAN